MRPRILYFSSVGAELFAERLAALVPTHDVVIVDDLTPDQLSGKTGDVVIVDDYSALECKIRQHMVVDFPVPTEPERLYRPNRQYGKRYRRSLRGGHR